MRDRLSLMAGRRPLRSALYTPLPPSRNIGSRKRVCAADEYIVSRFRDKGDVFLTFLLTKAFADGSTRVTEERERYRGFIEMR